MNRNLQAVSFFFLALLALSGCKEDTEEKCAVIPDTKDITISLTFTSLEDSLPAVQSKKEMVDFFSRHVALRDFFFNRSAYPSDSAFVNELYGRFSSPHIDTLLMETKKVFGDGTALKEEFSKAFANMKYYYPDFEIPRIETVITGLENDLFISDSLIIVGLDYYLGQGAKYRPNMYEYMLRRYEKNFIVPSTVLLYGIDSRYNKTDLKDRTILADMVTYGKAYYFAKQMLPCVPDSVLIGYTAKEIAGARANQDIIWKKLIEEEVFYSTDQKARQHYIGDRPKTFEVGDQAPGRIGMWVGWQIVKEYARRKEDMTLPEIMKMTDAQGMLKESKYRPL